MKLTGVMRSNLRLVRAALQQVIDNQEYQQRTGGKYFTSAPTEYEAKAYNQKITDEAVVLAIGILNNILSEQPLTK